MGALLSPDDELMLGQMREGARLDLHAWGGDQQRAYCATRGWLEQSFGAEQVRRALAFYLIGDAVAGRGRGADV